MEKDNFNLHGFYLPEIIKECYSFADTNKQLDYLKYVLYKWEVDPPELDPNGTLIPPFEERIKKEIQILIDLSASVIITNGKQLKKFKRGELKKRLNYYAERLHLEKYETVPSKRINWITRQLINEGFDANEESVASTLRKMDYSYGHEP